MDKCLGICKNGKNKVEDKWDWKTKECREKKKEEEKGKEEKEKEEENNTG